MSTDSSMAPFRAQLMRLAWGGMVSQAISVAAELRVADALADGPRAVEDLAQIVEADATSLYRLLRTLADFDVFAELEGRRFASTALSATLRTDTPDSVRDWVVMVGRPFHRMAWTGLLDSVRTGDSAFERVHGSPAWDHGRDNPEDGRVFDAAMTAVSSGGLAPIAYAYDFGLAGTVVVDVGGGRGGLIAAILAAHPGVRGVLFDLPHVVCDQVVDEAGLGDRCTYVGGDFFAEVPAGDVYVLGNILHDWDDERAVRILRNCRAAMNPGGCVLLGEAVLPDTPEPSPAKLMDLEMLVMNPRGARQRTADEFRALFALAGLRMSGIVGRVGPFDLIEAVAADGTGRPVG